MVKAGISGNRALNYILGRMLDNRFLLSLFEKTIKSFDVSFFNRTFATES